VASVPNETKHSKPGLVVGMAVGVIVGGDGTETSV
jgi:hypothetical protein